MTSGAIQHGVPTNVVRFSGLVLSPYEYNAELTPKSEEKIEPLNSLQHYTISKRNQSRSHRIWGSHRKSP